MSLNTSGQLWMDRGEEKGGGMVEWMESVRGEL